MAKTFVIDTNVLLHDPDAITKFGNNDVVLPVPVLEELDKMKRYRDELGKNARAAIRLLDVLKQKGQGDFHEGVKIPAGATIRIQVAIKADFGPSLPLAYAENKIILAAYLLKEKGEDVTFISKDLAARVKAEAMGITAEDYRFLKVSYEEMYTGYRQVEVEKRDIELFFKDGGIKLELPDLCPNEYVHLLGTEQASAVGRYNHASGKVESLLPLPQDIWGIKPLNFQQVCALDLLLRDDVPLVTLVGIAGTGKTMLALATALRKVFDEATYSRVLVSRPIMPLGRDIGYLPGTKEEKLQHWMQPIHDNLEFLCETSGQEPTDTLRWVLESNKLEMEAVTYIRGRTLPKVFMIIDEAQNLTPHEVKTIISRSGAGSKVVLTGDPTQIDNPYLDKDSNGLTYAISHMKEHGLFGHVLLEKTERSPLAALAAEVL